MARTAFKNILGEGIGVGMIWNKMCSHQNEKGNLDAQKSRDEIPIPIVLPCVAKQHGHFLFDDKATPN